MKSLICSLCEITGGVKRRRDCMYCGSRDSRNSEPDRIAELEEAEEELRRKAIAEESDKESDKEYGGYVDSIMTIKEARTFICPFLKKHCVANKCMFWSGGECRQNK